MFAGITGGSAAPAYAVPAAPPAATSALGRKPVVVTTTTTTVPPTTTTLLPLPTTPGHGPGPNPGGPTPSTTSTSIPAPTTTVSPQVIDALVRSVQNDLAQVDAIAGYDQDKGIVTANEANAASADSSVDAATRAERDATARVASGEASVADTQRRLAALAVALYVRSDMGQSAKIADPSVDAMVNRGVVLGILISHGRDQVAQAKRRLQDDRVVLRVAQQRAASARAFQAVAHQVLSKSAVALANAKLAAAGRAVKPTTGTPLPTIMGPAALNAGELAGWYAATHYQANTTVPMPTLAGYYLSNGTTVGLRGDIAFAQSIVETGYFTFPSGGQLLGTDNNFAGIGACDSCSHGWRFPDAQTGVAAQEQLLQAYATPKKIPTPLVGRVSVAGCCLTWLALSGVWATATNYGYAILTVYKQMLDWAIPQRLVVAGL
ncbi:MAG: hypothetical protein QOJ52_2974 [Acidimicrobiaceae bacterium]|nr:hypothetical protein [Acidimicrobiaceae bacterium]